MAQARRNAKKGGKKGMRQAARARPAPRIVAVPQQQVQVPRNHAICGLVDPFCVHAQSSKWNLDTDLENNTFSRSFRGLLTLTSNNQGVCGFYFVPRVAAAVWAAYTPGAGSTIGFDFAQTLNDIGVSAYTDPQTVRVKSAGVRWWSVQPLTSTRGSVVAVDIRNPQSHAGDTMAATTVPTTVPTQVLPLETGGAWVSRMAGNPTSKTLPLAWQQTNFTLGSAPASPVDDAVGTALVLMVNGAASTQVLQVEYFINFEINPDSIEAAFNGSGASTTQVESKIAREMMKEPNFYPTPNPSASIASKVKNGVIEYVHGLNWQGAGKAAAGYLLPRAAAKGLGFISPAAGAAATAAINGYTAIAGA